MWQFALWMAFALPGGIDADRVAALIRQLSDEQQSVRTAAVTELETLGPAVLPLLPAESTLDDAAARDAVVRLRKLLEKQLAQQSVQPSRVTLSGSKPLGTILDEIERQTGNPIDWPGALASESPKPFAAKWQRTPFWSAVNDVCQATDRQPRWDRSRGWLVAVPERQEREVTSTVSGAFRISVRDLGWKPLPRNEEKLLRVGMAVQAEPRLRPLFIAVRPGDWNAKLKTTRLSAWNQSAEYELPFTGDDRQTSWTLDLVAPGALDPRGPLSVHGTFRAHLAAGTESFVFEAAQFERGNVIRRGDVSVRLKSSHFDPKSRILTVKISVSYAQGGPAFESHRIGAFARSARIETPDGMSLPFRDFDVLAEADGGLAVEYRFSILRDDVRDYRFVYEAPTLLIDVPVEVDLKIPATDR